MVYLSHTNYTRRPTVSLHVIPRLIDNWLETKANWKRARARARTRTYSIDRREASAVRGYCFRILHIVRDRRLIDIFVGSRSLEFRVCAHVVAGLFLARTYLGRRTLCLSTPVSLARARAPLDLSVSSGFKSREIYPFPLLFPYWNSSIQLRNPFRFSIHRCCCCCRRRRRRRVVVVFEVEARARRDIFTFFPRN